MLFRRKHEKLDEDIKEMSEDELQEKIDALVKKQRKRYKLKKVALCVFIALVTIGSFKSLANNQQGDSYVKAINDYAFVEEYLKQYYTYPVTDESRQYLEAYTLETVKSAEYSLGKVKSAQLQNVAIYKVNENEDGTRTYYANANLKAVTEDNETNKKIALKIRVAEKNDAFLVLDPVGMVSASQLVFSEEDKKLYQRKENNEGTECSDDTKKELENTIRLFFKTYSSDYEQARLLMNEPNSLDQLDTETVIEVENFNSIKQTETYYIVKVNVVVKTADVVNQRRTYQFEIDKTTNKILDMEVF